MELIWHNCFLVPLRFTNETAAALLFLEPKLLHLGHLNISKYLSEPFSSENRFGTIPVLSRRLSTGGEKWKAVGIWVWWLLRNATDYRNLVLSAIFCWFRADSWCTAESNNGEGCGKETERKSRWKLTQTLGRTDGGGERRTCRNTLEGRHTKTGPEQKTNTVAVRRQNWFHLRFSCCCPVFSNSCHMDGENWGQWRRKMRIERGWGKVEDKTTRWGRSRRREEGGACTNRGERKYQIGWVALESRLTRASL